MVEKIVVAGIFAFPLPQIDCASMKKIAVEIGICSGVLKLFKSDISLGHKRS